MDLKGRTGSCSPELPFEVDGDVYDVTKFAGVHPGGTQILLEYAGKDAGHAVMQEYERERERRQTMRLRLRAVVDVL